MWPGESAVGKRVQRSSTSPWITVIGVVGDVSDGGFGQAPLETLYAAYAQQNNTNAPATLVVRRAGDSAAVVAGIRAAVLAIDPDDARAPASLWDSSRRSSFRRGGRRGSIR
jgi:hypothetical protein